MSQEKGPADVVTYMVDTEEVVIDDALDQVEDAPAGEHEAEVEAPVRGQPTLTPRGDRGDRAEEDEEPGRDVEEPVGQRIHLESGDGGHRVVLDVTDHVVPLEDLVQTIPSMNPPKPRP